MGFFYIFVKIDSLLMFNWILKFKIKINRKALCEF
jgi:hypothetical protein